MAWQSASISLASSFLVVPPWSTYSFRGSTAQDVGWNVGRRAFSYAPVRIRT